MITHHNFIFEFMRIFGRNENVKKKPEYLWTAAIEMEFDGEINLYLTEAERMSVFRKIKVLDFKIILE